MDLTPRNNNIIVFNKHHIGCDHVKKEMMISFSIDYNGKKIEYVNILLSDKQSKILIEDMLKAYIKNNYGDFKLKEKCK